MKEKSPLADGLFEEAGWRSWKKAVIRSRRSFRRRRESRRWHPESSFLSWKAFVKISSSRVIKFDCGIRVEGAESEYTAFTAFNFAADSSTTDLQSLPKNGIYDSREHGDTEEKSSVIFWIDSPGYIAVQDSRILVRKFVNLMFPTSRFPDFFCPRISTRIPVSDLLFPDSSGSRISLSSW